MKEIKVLMLSKREHCSQILTGLLMLESGGGGYCVKISDLTENVDFPNHHTPLVGIEYLGKKIIIDVEDGYWDKSGMEYYLNWCDYYFKRSYSLEKNNEFTQHLKDKIRPFGLNYAVYYRNNPYNTIGWSVQELVKNLAGKKPAGYFTPSKFEEEPKRKNTPVVLFSCRLWEPSEKLPQYLNEEREYINQTRINLVRQLKKEYGKYFVGGVQKSAYAMQYAKDILLPRTMTERGRYLKTLHQSDICIGTMGLHKSIGWKTAEYVAASKGIVNETLHYEVPGNFLEGKNYLAFITNEAKILCKPIVITNYVTAPNSIESGKNGLIVGMTSDELARGVASYFENEELRKQVVEQLRNEQNSNDAEIEKYIALFTELMESNV